MATFDHPSDLLHGIAYAPRVKREPRIDSQARTFPPREEKQPRLPSNPQLTEEDRIFFQVESGVRRNPLAAAGSVAFQVIVLATLLIVPLYFTQTLPQREVLLTRVYLRPPAAAGSSATTVHAPVSTLTPRAISIPNPTHQTQESTPTPPQVPVPSTSGVVGGVPGGLVGGAPIGVLSEVLGSTRSVPVPARTPDAVPLKRIRVAARVVEANLIHDVTPQYPPEAGRARIEGTVVLLATIGADGCVKDVRVESGLPILAQAAINAVRQWRYKPYMIDGEPVEVDSRITINFNLSAS
jgi:periplasmic protein TonB